MTLRGKIKNGKILLDKPSKLPDGTEVEIRPITKARKSARTPKLKKQPRSLADRLRPVIGIAKNLPPDMSVNLDHYLYDSPKRK
jgi:hypothetical protein